MTEQQIEQADKIIKETMTEYDFGEVATVRKLLYESEDKVQVQIMITSDISEHIGEDEIFIK